MLIVDERISIPRCTLTAPKSCEKAIGNVDTRPLPPVFPHCTEQWGLATYTNLAATATFPIAFSDVNYIGVAMGVLEIDSQSFIRGILKDYKTTTGCLFRSSDSGGPAAEYVVIGR